MCSTQIVRYTGIPQAEKVPDYHQHDKDSWPDISIEGRLGNCIHPDVRSNLSRFAVKPGNRPTRRVVREAYRKFSARSEIRALDLCESTYWCIYLPVSLFI